MKIILNWPSRDLHPNARVHWSVKAKAAKKAREDAAWLTKAARVKAEGDSVTLKITFRPPDKRRRDLDGMLSSLKSAIDGIADGLGVNDSRFRYQLKIGEKYVDGCVIVEITS